MVGSLLQDLRDSLPGRLTRPLLLTVAVPFGASARNPMTFALACVFPAVVALALCHLSAGQAAPTNPIAAWRHA
jgi:hypothetical protein